MRATNKAPKTIKSYTDTLRRFRDFLTESGMPTDIRHLTREHVETYIAVQFERFRPKTAQILYGDFKWAAEEREVGTLAIFVKNNSAGSFVAVVPAVVVTVTSTVPAGCAGVGK